MVENPPSTSGDTDSIPGQQTKISHATGQLDLHATTRKPVCPSYTPWSPQDASREKPAHHNEDPVQPNFLLKLCACVCVYVCVKENIQPNALLVKRNYSLKLFTD